MNFTKRLALMAAGVALAFPVFYGANTVTTHASSIYSAANPIWNRLPWITLRRNVKVLKVRNVTPEYKSYSVGTFIAKKGYHYRLGHGGANYSWTLESGRFNSHSNDYYNSYKYTYVVSEKRNSHSWFQFGIH